MFVQMLLSIRTQTTFSIRCTLYVDQQMTLLFLSNSPQSNLYYQGELFSKMCRRPNRDSSVHIG
jgi:hypothetical protein